jgi:hypothetical protein
LGRHPLFAVTAGDMVVLLLVLHGFRRVFTFSPGVAALAGGISTRRLSMLMPRERTIPGV